ncbi:MAG TPA: glutamate 5-kinase [Actinobacteria bacterium]|nr:glutamate 5-kinase [Actinomycetota bacterium]
MEETRKKYLKKIKKVVVKIGSSSLTSPMGGLDMDNLMKFTSEISDIWDQGLKTIIVTSGAIAAGIKYLGLNEKPGKFPELQAVAAVGQHDLMRVYSSFFYKMNKKVGQILLSREDTTKREQYLNIKNTIISLLGMNVIPIINENDSVALDEIKFGDNDTLAALVAGLTEADLLIILSDIDGLYSKNPQVFKNAELISIVRSVDEDIEKIAGGIGSSYGSGGMITKIRAAKICSFSGIPMVIANSRKENILKNILSGADTGTFFVPEESKKIASIKRWIAFGMITKGSIRIDKGAEEAIVRKGKSLLPVGVTEVNGKFVKGDNIAIISSDDRTIAKGITNFTSDEIMMIKGKREDKIMEEFGCSLCCEIIHRDSMFVL